MRSLKLIVYFILGTSLLVACKKEGNWITCITDISNITTSNATITVDYDFGGKSSSTMVGVIIGLIPDLKSGFEIFQQDQNANGTVTFEKSQLYANQTYYVQSYMLGRKDTIWSEIKSFTTLSEPLLPCTVSSGEIYYSAHEMTEAVGSLVQIENATNSDFFTYEVEADIGDLTLTFSQIPSPGNFITTDEIIGTYDDQYFVQVECWYENGGSICHYKADRSQNIHLSKDINENISIAFCDLKLTKSDAGSCAETQEISGRLDD